MNKKIILTIALSAFLSFCAVFILGLGKAADKSKRSLALSPMATSSIQIQVVDEGAVLPALYEPNAQVLLRSLPVQHQFWVIDTPLMQESVSQRFSFPIPNVDFKTDQLIFLFQGTKNTGGYAIKVKQLEENDTQLKIWISLEEPGKTCATTQSITTPFLLIKVPVTSKRVMLLPQQKIIECE